MTAINLAWLALPLGILGVLAAVTVYGSIRRLPAGNESMRMLSRQIEAGTEAFMLHGYMALGGMVALLAGLVWLMRGSGTAGAFVTGALGSMLAGYIGVKAATKVNVRVAESARASGAAAALRTLLDGASVIALAVGSLGMLGVALVYYLAIVRGQSYPVPEEILHFAEIATGLVLGASVVTLFAHTGGAIFRAAAERGVEMTAAHEAGIPRGDPRDPATLACNVGNNVDDTAGTAADLFGSYVACVIAAIVIGATSALYADNHLEAITLPILAIGTGLIATLFAVMLLPTFSRGGGGAALRNMALASAVIFMLLVLVVTLGLGFDLEDPVTGRILGIGTPFWALGAGTVAGIVTGLLKPRWLGGAGSLLPLLIVVGAGWGGYAFAGSYGLGLAAVGMLATVGTAVWASAYRAVAGSTRLIARVSRLSSDARHITDDLGAAGATVELGGRRFAITAAAVATLAMLAAYVSVINLDAFPLGSFGVILGLLLGVLLPPAVGALSTLGVVRGAGVSSREAERQYQEIPGLLQGAAEADAARSVVTPVNVVLRDLAVPTLVTLLLPVMIGYLLGPAALAALLVGTMVSGIPLALFLAHAEVHAAGGAVHPGFPPQIPVMLRAMLATPYRFAAAASITTLIKVLAAVSLVLAPLLAVRASS